MSQMESLRPLEGADEPGRRRLGTKGELLLALLPTATVLAVLALVEAMSRQRLLFASLASSAFLIYLDPKHGTNAVRTLVVAQMTAAGIGLGAFMLFGPGYTSAGTAMVLTIVLMILLDAVHPPAVSTALAFAVRAGDESNVLLFALAVGMTALLVLLQRAAVWLVMRYRPRSVVEQRREARDAERPA